MNQGTIQQEIARQACEPHAPYWRPLKRIKWLQLPNWRWRREAIAVHDVHHALTGYPMTARGEMRMAAWEFAAGRFRHPAATAFCLPLVGLGAIACPKLTFLAFISGRRSKSLYGLESSDPMLDLPVNVVKERLTEVPSATLWDRVAFALLIILSWGWILLPVLLLAFTMAWLVG